MTSMIVSDAYCHAKYAMKSHEWFLKNSTILRLDFMSDVVIFDAAVRNMIYLFRRGIEQNNVPLRRLHSIEFGDVELLGSKQQSRLTTRTFTPKEGLGREFDVPTQQLNEICYITVGMVVNSHETKSPISFKMEDLVVDSKDSLHPKPFVEGKDLYRWYTPGNQWLEWGTVRAPSYFRRPTFPEIYQVTEKLLVQRSPGPDPKACLDNRQLHFTESTVGFILWQHLKGVRNRSIKKVARYRDERSARLDLPLREMLEITSKDYSLKYLLGILNSSTVRYLLNSNRRSNIHLYPEDWKELLIPQVDLHQQQPVINLVENILSRLTSDRTADVSELEAAINGHVYRLYNLTPAEIALIGGKSAILPETFGMPPNLE